MGILDIFSGGGSSGLKHATQNANNLSQSTFQDMLARGNPYLQAGQFGINGMQQSLGQDFGPDHGNSFESYMHSPFYNAQKQAGESAINAGASARGQYFNPSTVSSLGHFNNDLLNQYYNTYQQDQEAYRNNRNDKMNYMNALGNYGYNMTNNLNQQQYQNSSDINDRNVGYQNAKMQMHQNSMNNLFHLAGAALGAYGG